MNNIIKSMASHSQGSKLEKYSYDVGDIKNEQVEIDVIACGIYHSDISILNNGREMSEYPFVPEHEIIGKVSQIGDNVKNLFHWTNRRTWVAVFNPIIQSNVKPTDKVGVTGIGGLGHMALMFLNKWGCEVTVFTHSTCDIQSKCDSLC